MEKRLIVVKSITYAMRGQQILNNYGISAYIERISGERYGCGYSIRVHAADSARAVQILQDYDIRVVDVLAAGGAMG